ncbi:MAG: hypothetical protein VW684_12440 [Betaproteobacteria bacterium]
MMKLIQAALFFLITGCATSMISAPPVYEINLTQAPSIKDSQVTAELGETLVLAICSRHADSWRISELGLGEDDVQPKLSDKITMWNFPSQVLKPKGTTSDGLKVFVATIGSEGLPGSRKPVDGNGGLFNSFCEKEGVLHFRCNSLKSTPFVEVAKAEGKDGWAEKAIFVDLSYPSVRQELIYNGRIENDIKFVYRELATLPNGNSIMRDPFQQEVQYDLSDSDTIGFKGMRLKVLDATNTEITYEVLRHFPIDCTQQI